MLVLTRRTNESIVLGDNVEITVIRVSPHTVKLGIQAPSGISVTRSELLRIPVWCENDRFPKPDFCRGVSEKQTQAQNLRCRKCPYCNASRLPAA